MNTLNLRNILDDDNQIDYPIWHPYSNLTKNYFNQIILKRGEGTFVYDNDNRKYLDACSGLWNVSLGYGNETINSYIEKQMKLMAYCSIFEHSNSTAIMAANMIVEYLPSCMNKIQFTCSGSESVELSIKIMREYWKLTGKKEKEKIISFTKSYHGTCYGGMSVSGITKEQTRNYAPYLLDTISFQVPDSSMNVEEGKLHEKTLEEYITMNADSIAGIVVEPILASAGMERVDIKFIERLYRLCKENEILITIDEVATGFYRTGKRFYFENYCFVPDIVCMSKGINSGYVPFGAVGIQDFIVERYKKSNAIIAHGTTQAGNLLGCASTIGTLEEYKNLNISVNVNKQGKYLKSSLIEGLKSHPNIKGVRGEGLLISIDLQEDTSGTIMRQEKIAYIQQELAINGILVYRSLVGLTLMPMLNIKKEESFIIAEKIISFFSNDTF
ncbi:aspartate aminotransferase family protein [Petralouisia muris]|jgi:adenosylmethionine-8-amino-7-oxononanoate aminotransferase|uniref:Aspartate aminotransferase family protein n=1 Tax=Petralouisia muris TaxID=3032872 RepID=A0AC61RNW0_9FIRM|nr:aminotransferase class III-fold pyridoxal phosphate-dependent enzyme [Petralouisia muris]TGY89434.1 aspartate aminotransferase family protein [Petralouisia muris]